MKLLIITQTVDRNDSNLAFFHSWLDVLAKKTDELFVIAGSVGDYDLPPNVHMFSMGREHVFGRLRRYFYFYKYALRILPRVDAVFVHMIPWWVILILPLARFFHEKIYLWYTHKSVTKSLRWAEKMVKAIFTASAESCRVDSTKIIVTGHGIDVEHFKPLAPSHRDSQVRLLSVGRISPAKNYEFLLDVMMFLKERVGPKRFHLDIVGAPLISQDVVYKKKLRHMIERQKLSGDVDFLGPALYSELPRIYNAHDILLHTSVTGSIDKVVLECMACGVPAITSSDAFNFLLPQYLADVKSVGTMVEKIIALSDATKDPMLREIVVKNHNLSSTIDTIIKEMSACNQLKSKTQKQF